MLPWLLLPLLLVGGHAQVIGKSPICKDLCRCSDKEINYDVDCSDKVARFLEILLTSGYYKNAKNETYSINKLSFTDVLLGSLNATFPPSELKVLDLSRNSLRNISDEAFKNLQNMTELILSHNALGNRLKPDLFKGIRVDGRDYPLKSFKTLRLDHNGISTLDSDIFQHVDRELENLYLSGNPFVQLDEATIHAIGSVALLKVLDLSDCKLTTLPQYFLHPNGHLVMLNLSSNIITDVNTLGLDLATELEMLDLSDNLVQNLTQQSGFPVMKSLKVLHMCRMPVLAEVSEHSLGNLGALEELHLADNRNLQKIHQDALIRTDMETGTPVVQKLKRLYINNNELSYMQLEIRWELITDFDIRNNPWSCDCDNQLILELMVPKYEEIGHQDYAKELMCAAPIEMVHMNMYILHEEKYVMRCLDLYGNRPERDGTILVCLLLGLLLGIVSVLGCMYSYKKHWFGVFDDSPAAFSRQFYGRTKSTEDDDIY